MANLELMTAPDLQSNSVLKARFDVRVFTVSEGISALFRVHVEALHPNPSLEFEDIVGKEAHFSIASSVLTGDASRRWSGVISQLELVRALTDGEGLSTYRLTLVPELWLLTQ